MAQRESGWLSFVTAHSTGLVLIGLALLLLLAYFPILPGGFLNDDHVHIAHFLDRGRDYVQGSGLGYWFFEHNGAVFLRPVLQWLWLSNYIFWGVSATGYYLTNILLHVLNAFLVYLLIWRVIRHRLGAAAGAILFALHPTHPNSVAWIADGVDVLAALFSLLCAVFFVLYRQRGERRFFALSASAFALATLTKESTVALPIALLAYDILFTFRRRGWSTVWAQAAIWSLVPAYFVFRFLAVGGIAGAGNTKLAGYGWDLFFQFYVLALAKPFLSDMNTALLLMVFALLAVLLVAFRRTLGLWLGLAWIASTLLPASAAYVADRLIYIPSVGLAVAQAAVLVEVHKRRTSLSQAAAVVLFLVVASAYGLGLVSRVDDWAGAGTLSSVVPQELRKLQASFPENSRVYFVGIPEIVRGVDVYGGNFPFAIRNAYPGNPYFRAFSYTRFPVLTDLDHAYFFEYRRRSVIERGDISDLLLGRKRCPSDAYSAFAWEFARDAQGWEPWSDLADVQVRGERLAMRATGGDPIIGGPRIDISSVAIGDIQITMAARADRPVLGGEVFWLVEGMEDFSPAMRIPFQVQADGAEHVYKLDISSTEQLAIGDRIVQLRFDPADAPADLALSSIRVFSRCDKTVVEQCKCR